MKLKFKSHTCTTSGNGFLRSFDLVDPLVVRIDDENKKVYKVFIFRLKQEEDQHFTLYNDHGQNCAKVDMITLFNRTKNALILTDSVMHCINNAYNMAIEGCIGGKKTVQTAKLKDCLPKIQWVKVKQS